MKLCKEIGYDSAIMLLNYEKNCQKST